MATVPSPKGKPEPKPAESKPEPLKYKTWELKVPLYCGRCEKKVKEILTKIEGVHTVNIDFKGQKATVVGNVDSETLIKELIKKTSKHVELWPQGDQEQKEQGKGKSEKVKAELNQGVTSPAGSQSPVSESESGGKKSGGGGGGKKKKDKGLKGNSTKNEVQVRVRGSREQQAQPCPREGSSHSWYPPVVSSPNSIRPPSPSNSGFNSINYPKPTDQPESPSHVSPAEEAGLIALLKDKSVDELQRLLSDEDAYNQFFLSVPLVKTENSVSSKF
ncbi:hypothetical protein SLEP1_g28852 [Rubroshorea leprosula]|uniref:HMA domain-containing protein n=2 Tax=Rubroshorea leprosula TaxID=152421 RepID=A0AAV5JXL0_9ROSI|nr:hypothetical protein SLEP1_g28852 [Rubroshorea leprosula]